MNKKIIFRWLKIAILLYCVIGIAWYYAQDRLLLHPVKVDQDTTYSFRQPFTELFLNYDTATSLNVMQLRTADSPARGVILFFHDGSGNIGDYTVRSEELTRQGYECWMMDYPGFGKSTGPMSEQRLYDLALVFYKLARSRWKPSQIVIYGQGFGTGIAAQLASVRDCRRLILEEPYYSMTGLLQRYLFLYPVGMMSHYHLPTYSYLQAVTAPVTFIDGDGSLRSSLKPGDEWVAAGTSIRL